METRTAKQKRLDSYGTLQRSLVRDVAGLGTPALGPDFADLSGESLADSLVVHRLVKHFSSSEVMTAEKRREVTIAAMLKYDLNGVGHFDYRQLKQPYRGQVLKIKEQLAAFFKGMKRRHQFRAPTGETAWSSGGLVDLMTKLLTDEQWMVSIEAASEAAAVAYHNTALKREVKRRFRAKYPMWKVLLRRTYAKWAFSVELSASEGVWCAKKESFGFLAFKHMFLNCCTIQNFDRLSTVPKNAHSDRVISMVPLWTMVAQLSYASDMRAHLRLKLGIDLDSLASLHRTLIRHAKAGTVDFKNASNSNWLAVLRFLMPQKVVAKLEQLRSPICCYKGKFHYYKMLAPMGCGFTFEVMTIVLLHIGRSIDSSTSVFGDDVIMRADNCAQFIDLAEHLGWRVNRSKTFYEGNFRESCGGFHDLTTKQDILSYEMHEVKDDYDACTLANKLFRIIAKRQVSPDLREMLYGCYSKIIRILPDDVYRTVDEVTEDLPEGVVIVDCDTLASVKPRELTQLEILAEQYLHTKMRIARKFEYTLREVDICEDDVPPQLLLSCFLYRGSSYIPTIRGSEKQTKKVVYAKSNGSLATIPMLSFI